MKLSSLLAAIFEKIDLRPGADSSYPSKKFDYEEWKRLSKPMKKLDKGDDKKNSKVTKSE